MTSFSDLQRIGIVAVQREILPLLAAFEARERGRRGEAILYAGEEARRTIALAQVLPGPVAAALGAQALIIDHGVSALISVGSAGALDAKLTVGDLVIARRAVAHDAGTFLGSRFEHAGVMGRGRDGRTGHRRAFHADPELVTAALNTARTLDEQVHAGTVVTGNQVIFSTARRRWLRQTFNALAVEMEAAAVAQVAVAHRIPWVAVRAISDAASDQQILNYARLRVYLDDDRSPWYDRVRRGTYLLTHPAARRRLRRLRRGLALASGRAARLVEVMLKL